MNLSDRLAVRTQDGRTEASVKLVRMWHWAQAEQCLQLSQRPGINKGEQRKFELRGIMHTRFVEALDVLFETSVTDDIKTDAMQQAKIKLYKVRG